MIMKKKMDAGLAYLQEIGFNRSRGKYGLVRRWEELFGREKAFQLYNQWTKIEDSSPEFYDFKNSDPEISRSYIEAYDGDIIRKACNYIYDHKEYFGRTILEVGCDIGYMTGFLAKTFPESTIVAIDRNKAAISLATKCLEALGIKNVLL